MTLNIKLKVTIHVLFGSSCMHTWFDMSVFFVYLSDLHSMKQIFVSLHAKNNVCFFKKIRIFLIDVVWYMCAKINKFVYILYFLCRIVGVFYNWIFMLRSGLSISLLVHSESGYVFWECVVKSKTVNHRFLEISALRGG